MLWYACYRTVRKHGYWTFTIQHVQTGIDKNVHANDIQLARGQTEWNIDPTWCRGRKVKYAYYPPDIDEKESTKIQVLLQNFH